MVIAKNEQVGVIAPLKNSLNDTGTGKFSQEEDYEEYALTVQYQWKEK